MGSGVIDNDTVWLVEVFPYDRAGSATVSIYLATRDVVFAADDPDAANREYDGRVITALTYGREMHADGAIGGASLPSHGAVRVALDTAFIEAGSLAEWRRYAWDGRSARVLRGTIGGTYASYTVMFDGVTTGENVYRLGGVDIPIAGIEALLQKPMHAVTYAGTGGTEGDAAMKGAHKPCSVGRFRGVTPVLADPATLTWDVDPVFGVTTIDLVEDGGNALAVTLTNPPSAGAYYFQTAAGRIITGSMPVYALTVDGVSGFAGGSTNAAEIILAALTAAGVSTARIDLTAITALAAANTAVVGAWFESPPDWQTLCDQTIASLGGFFSTTRDGLVTVGRLEPPVATAETHSAIALVITDEDIARGGLTILPVGSPPHTIEVGYQRCHAVQTEDRLAGAASADRRAFLTTEYRVARAANTATEAAHPLSGPLRTDTMLDAATAASALAARLSTQRADDRTIAEVTLMDEPFSLDLNDEVWVQSDLYDLDEAFRVIRADDSSGDPSTTLRLWR